MDCCCKCGCQSSQPKEKKGAYKCGICGKTSSKPGECCGKPMKKGK
ncbi:MAG: hypothetical protein BWY26_00909 [Elusimicrobia bacterium ADurb.Bin231]|nr:MAG: hypothetical protein BWY26_00909 [Elusimicrobia bacterium ADurb.Bin231]